MCNLTRKRRRPKVKPYRRAADGCCHKVERENREKILRKRKIAAAHAATRKSEVIDIHGEGKNHPLHPIVWSYFAQAAAVSFDDFHNEKPVSLGCLNDQESTNHFFTWSTPDDSARAAHANELDATRDGAYAVAGACAFATGGWRVVGRTAHGTGADLQIKRDSDPEDFFVKLEVSGIAKNAASSGESAFARRFVAKVEQVQKGTLTRPGIAVVVGFQAPRTRISRVLERKND